MTDCFQLKMSTLAAAWETSSPHLSTANAANTALHDVLSYREKRRKRQYDALAATADIDHDGVPETIREQLREARRAAAARRNKSAQPS
jgi:hypothetical protein